MTELTQEERDIVRAAALGAMALVSKSDPGFFATFRESLAGSRALASAPADIRELLSHGGFVMPPTGSATEVENSILEQLGQAGRILGAKSAQAYDGFRTIVLAACDAVAQADKGVSPAETAMIGRITTALAQPASPSAAHPSAPQDAPPVAPH